MHLYCGPCVIRSWRLDDAESIVRHANNRKVWLQLRDRFPHPYTMADAVRFLRSVVERRPETDFAIAVGDQAVGGIGFMLGTDVERCSAEIGYWLGEPFWGRGIATAALTAATQHALTAFDLTRVFAVPFIGNAASCRVLKKAGFVCEGVMRRSAVKDGNVMDQGLYAYVGENVVAAVPDRIGRAEGTSPMNCVASNEQLIVELSVRNIAESVEFYRALGFGILRKEEHFVELGWEDSPLFLEEVAGQPDPPPTPVGNIRIMVSDADRYWRLSRDLGLKVLRPIGDRDYGLRDFTVVSLDGLGLRFASMLPGKGMPGVGS